MGLYVHIHVCFACDSNEGAAALARKHLPTIEDTDDGRRAARWFLEDLSKRTGGNPGPKGGLSLWGMIGNYTLVKEFVECLRPFWKELLEGVEGGPCTHEHIIVFEEREQTERATAYEIALDKKDGEIYGEIRIATHECPFSFMQF